MRHRHGEVPTCAWALPVHRLLKHSAWNERSGDGIDRSIRRAVMPRTARSDTPPNARAKIFTNGRSQAVRLPREFRCEGKEVAVRKEGDAVILEPVAKRKWPAGYRQRIDRRAKDLD